VPLPYLVTNSKNMWKFIKANNTEFTELLPIIESFATDPGRISALKISGISPLVLARIDLNGIHEIVFSPKSFELLSYIEPAFEEYEVTEIEQPQNIGTAEGFGRMIGDEKAFKSLKP
jgi:hypothetical protein